MEVPRVGTNPLSMLTRLPVFVLLGGAASWGMAVLLAWLVLMAAIRRRAPTGLARPDLEAPVKCGVNG